MSIRSPRTGIFILCLVIGLMIGGGLYPLLFPTNAPFNPLGVWPTQMVNSRVPGVTIPAALTTGTVDVTAVKCNSSDKPVLTAGTKEWVLRTPVLGTSIDVTHGQSILPPGCNTQTFANPIPPEVVERTEQLYAQGAKSVTWAIQGEGVPIASDGTRGVPREWTTENFELVLP